MTLIDWSKRRVLVTGASGMIGSWLVQDLVERGAYVVALVRDSDPRSHLFRNGYLNRISVVSGKLEDFDTLERAINLHEVDTVFHLAAQSLVGVGHRFPISTFESNIRGTYNLLEAVRVHKNFVTATVVASSDKAYGDHETLPYTEETRLDARFPYEVSKACADMLARSYWATYNLPICIARCGNVYGGGDLNWSRIVPGTIRSLLLKEPLVIRSDGTFVREYIYVKDVVGAYRCTAEKLLAGGISGEAFNFGNERPITVTELVELLQGLLDCRHVTPVLMNAAVGEIRDQRLSSRKAQAILNWQPEFTLERGLLETIQWYRDYLRA